MAAECIGLETDVVTLCVDAAIVTAGGLSDLRSVRKLIVYCAATLTKTK